MPNLIVGLVATFVVVFCDSAYASTDTEFYTPLGQIISTAADGNSGSLYVSNSDDGCAVPASLEVGDTVYSCNGGCSLSASRYNIVDIPPNGSKFQGGPSISASDSLGELLGTGVTKPNYVCTLEGKWEPCAQVEVNNIPLNGDLAYAIELRKYTNIGYCDGEVWEATDMDQGTLTDFCSSPYLYYDNYVDDQVSDCVYTANTASGVKTFYEYDGCATGYRLSGGNCVSCGTAPSNATYNYTASGYHTNSTCVLTCDAGYLSNGSSCVAADSAKSYYAAGSCGYGYFDDSEYYGTGDCHLCPNNAKCDGWRFFCAAGYVGVAPADGSTPYCMECPRNGNLVNASPYNILGWDESVGLLYDCLGDQAGYMKGETTDCAYNDYWHETTDSAVNYCEAFLGEDKTGKYHWGDWGNGDVYSCAYDN